MRLVPLGRRRLLSAVGARPGRLFVSTNSVDPLMLAFDTDTYPRSTSASDDDPPPARPERWPSQRPLASLSDGALAHGISKVGNARLRRALYMPALVSIRWEPNVAAFYEKLTGRGKKPIMAVVAVMRKLLHAIYGMLKHGQDFQGEKFYRVPEKVLTAA